MLRHRLTDQQWELVEDLFPPPARTGRPRRDRREILDAILWILRTGAPWRDLPGELGPWATAWDLFDTWNDDGTLYDELQIAGTGGLITREDTLVAGSLVAGLTSGAVVWELNDEAAIARDAWLAIAVDADPDALMRALEASQGGRNLLREGSFKKVFARGRKLYGDIPDCRAICHLFGNVVSSYYVKDFWGLAGDSLR